MNNIIIISIIDNNLVYLDLENYKLQVCDFVLNNEKLIMKPITNKVLLEEIEKYNSINSKGGSGNHSIPCNVYFYENKLYAMRIRLSHNSSGIHIGFFDNKTIYPINYTDQKKCTMDLKCICQSISSVESEYNYCKGFYIYNYHNVTRFRTISDQILFLCQGDEPKSSKKIIMRKDVNFKKTIIVNNKKYYAIMEDLENSKIIIIQVIMENNELIIDEYSDYVIGNIHFENYKNKYIDSTYCENLDAIIILSKINTKHEDTYFYTIFDVSSNKIFTTEFKYGIPISIKLINNDNILIQHIVDEKMHTKIIKLTLKPEIKYEHDILFYFN